MHWIAPSEKDTDTDTDTLEKRTRDAADQFRVNFGLTQIHYLRQTRNLLLLSLRSGQVGLETEAA